jgi:hypothetical protein
MDRRMKDAERTIRDAERKDTADAWWWYRLPPVSEYDR